MVYRNRPWRRHIVLCFWGSAPAIGNIIIIIAKPSGRVDRGVASLRAKTDSYLHHLWCKYSLIGKSRVCPTAVLARSIAIYYYYCSLAYLQLYLDAPNSVFVLWMFLFFFFRKFLYAFGLSFFSSNPEHNCPFPFQK